MVSTADLIEKEARLRNLKAQVFEIRIFEMWG